MARFPRKFAEGMPFIFFKSYKYTLPMPNIPLLNNQNNRTKGDYDDVALYMPGDFTESANAEWSMQDVLQGGGGGASNLAGLGAANIAKYAGASNAGQTALQSVQGGFGKLPFPTDVFLFKGITPLGFTLNFKMIPFDAGEAAEITDICTIFKKSMMPVNDGTTKNILLSFPNIWDVKFEGIIGVGYEDSLFQNMAITNCSVSYISGTEGASVYKDQRPTQVNLTISFQAITRFFLQGK